MEFSTLLIKFSLFSLIVIVLTLIAQRANPKLSGVLAAFPTTQAFTLFFYAHDMGPAFAAKSSLYNLAGIMAASLMIVVYYFCASKQMRQLYCVLFSVVTFILSAAIISLLPKTTIGSVSMALTGIFLIFLSLKLKPTNKLSSSRRESSTVKVISKSFFSSLIVLSIIELGKKLSPELAGVMSAFPATLFPTLCIVHYELGANALKKFVIGVPLGQFAMIAYGLTNFSFVGSLGFVSAMLLAYIAATSAIIILKRPINLMLYNILK